MTGEAGPAGSGGACGRQYGVPLARHAAGSERVVPRAARLRPLPRLPAQRGAVRALGTPTHAGLGQRRHTHGVRADTTVSIAVVHTAL